jgi:alkanesulfonate monooxygenase SsuD/methylene tetrahydromethanopterin reductase-like flavin-dependent oxidoreductase (luciferase family)
MKIGTGGGVIRAFGDSRPLVELYRGAARRAIEAEQCGFDFINVGEHHFAPNQWNPASLPLLAYFAARTSSIRIGTNVLVAPYHNPLRVAEDVATVDLLSNGRLDLVVGGGSIAGEFETFGVDPKERWGRMFETLEVVRRCFVEDVFDHQGRYFRFPNIRMTTRPVQQPFPLWVATTGPKTVKRVAREGYHLQVPGFGSASNCWNTYADALRERGREPNNFNFHIMASIVVAERWDDRAAAEMNAGIKAFRRFYEERATVFEGTAHQIDDHPSFQPVAGTPEQVLRHLEPILKNSSVTHLQANIDHRTVSLFVKEVMPMLRKWGREPATQPRS